MLYKDEFYYKIGRALNVAKREIGLKVGNPFLSIVAFKLTINHEKMERTIQNSIKEFHFSGEWYKLPTEQYQALYEANGFSEYTDEERNNQLKYGHIAPPKEESSPKFHVFKKPKIIGGICTYRWYYYFYNSEGKKIQKACPKCRNRSDAEDYIRTLPPLAEVNCGG